MSNEEYIKIHFNLPNHPVSGGESMWAKALGDDLFEIGNVPFFAYGVNYLDIVRAVSPTPDLKPFVEELVRSSGHKTLRVVFTDKLPDGQRRTLLEELKVFQADYEPANRSYFAIDIEPHGDYDSVCDQLAKWEADDILEYETCETQVAGSFDAAPEEIEE